MLTLLMLEKNMNLLPDIVYNLGGSDDIRSISAA